MLRLCLYIFLYCLSTVAYGSYQLTPKKIASNTWLLEGVSENFQRSNGGNIANISFIVTASEVILIDSGPSFAYGRELLTAIRTITDHPIKHILITHHHPDHMLGNQAFPDAKIYALPETNKLIVDEGDTMTENMYRLVGDSMRSTEVVPPTTLIAPGVFTFGDYPLELIHMHGHSNADLVVFDPRTKVLFTGDIVFYQRALATAHTPSIKVWLKDIEQLKQRSWKVLVPGHGPITHDQRALKQMREYLIWLDKLMQQGVASGKDINQLIQEPIPQKFSHIKLAQYELVRTLTHLYPTYEEEHWKALN